MRSFYEILHIDEKATQEEIQAAYRKRVLETHPDKGGDNIEFLNIKKGYDILSDPIKRVAYDKWLAEKRAKTKQEFSSREKSILNTVTLLVDLCCKNAFSKAVIPAEVQKLLSSTEINKSDSDILIAARLIDLFLYNYINSHRDNYDKTYYWNDFVIIGKKSHEIIVKETGKPYVSPKPRKVYEQNYNNENNKSSINTKEKEKENSNTRIIIILSALIIIIIAILYFKVDTSDQESIATDESYYDNTALKTDNEKEIRLKEIHKLEITNDKAQNLTNLYHLLKEAGFYNLPEENAFYDYLLDNSDRLSRIKTFLDSKGISYPSDLKERIGIIYKSPYITLKTGDTPYKDYYQTIEDRNSLSEITFINYSSNDAVVMLVNQNEEVIRHAFVSKKERYTMRRIPEGKYIAKIMFGNLWKPELDNGYGNPKGGFDDDLHFQTMKWNDSFDCIFEETNEGINYPSYSLTLHTVINGNTQTKQINANNYFK